MLQVALDQPCESVLMRAELSPRSGARAFRRLDIPRRRQGDLIPVAILIGLPVLVFVVPALVGHSVLPGDDLTQNYPLRVLVGRQIREGQLPLFDPYIWSGAPLLAGWNAGAAYPLTLLFAILPGAAAWTLNLLVTWAVTGLGMFGFLRALGLGRVASLAGALTFGFAGAMPAQVGHLGLVAGMSWVPVALLCVLRLTEPRALPSRLRWTGVLAAATGLMILAGEPRAIDDFAVIVAGYATWRIVRLRRRAGPAAASVVAGLALGAGIGAVQWLPGLVTVATSQRAERSMALFTSGSLQVKWMLLTLVPDLLGGSGSFGQPTFLSNYNFAEVTSYAGILPLVAAAALLARFRLRPRLPEWFIWHLLLLAGVILALGGRTPLGHLLYQLPLFGDQRLQSRNIMVADLALAVLLGYWADQLLTDRPPRGQPAGDQRPAGQRLSGRHPDLATVLGALPALGMIAVAALGLVDTGGLLRWLGADARPAGAAGRLGPWLIPYLLIGAGALALVLLARRWQPRVRARVICAFILLDLIVFTVLAVVAIAPGGVGSAASRAAASRPATSQASRPEAAWHSAARPVADLGYPGRFAIYDPGQRYPRELPVLGAPDLNVVTSTPSVQGYSAVVAGFYASATGSHRAMGGGQNMLAPQAIADGTLDQLDTSVLLTAPGDLVTEPGVSGPAPRAPGTGQREVAAHGRATWYLGAPIPVAQIRVPDPEARRDAASGARLGLVQADGLIRWFPARASGPSTLTAALPGPVTSVAVLGEAGSDAARLGPPALSTPDRRVFVANGPLQDALVPPRWRPAGHDGSFAVFADRFARGPLSLQALAGRSLAGASVRSLGGPADAPDAAEVRSPHGVRVIRAVAAIPGWSATWHPASGPARTLPVTRDGLVQAVTVPPGRGLLTWSYLPPRLQAGLATSVLAAAVTLLIALFPAGRWRRAGRR
jgi:hypothetical protein